MTTSAKRRDSAPVHIHVPVHLYRLLQFHQSNHAACPSLSIATGTPISLNFRTTRTNARMSRPPRARRLPNRHGPLGTGRFAPGKPYAPGLAQGMTAVCEGMASRAVRFATETVQIAGTGESFPIVPVFRVEESSWNLTIVRIPNRHILALIRQGPDSCCPPFCLV